MQGRFFERNLYRALQDLGLKRLAAEMPFKFADAILELPHGLVTSHVILPGHGDTPFFEYESSSMIQQVGCNAAAQRWK